MHMFVRTCGHRILVHSWIDYRVGRGSMLCSFYTLIVLQSLPLA